MDANLQASYDVELLPDIELYLLLQSPTITTFQFIVLQLLRNKKKSENT